MIVYHNPRCSKSRQTLQLCEEAGSEVEIIEYLKTPLDEVILKDILKKLDKPVYEVVRTKEEVYEQLNLSSDSTEEEIIAAIIKYPVLLERPIVVKDDKAVIGRPPENVKVLL